MVLGGFLVESKYADFGIVINPSTVVPGYWQKHVK